jgi:hypothetical protein
MKKYLVAAIFFIICSVSFTCFSQNLPRVDAGEVESHDHILPKHELDSQNFFSWINQCISVFDNTIVKCVSRDFVSFVSLKGEKVHISSKCCGAVKEYYGDCASKSLFFQPQMPFINWLMDSCGHQEPSPTPSAPPPPPPTQPSPTPSAPPPPTPIPTPPCSSTPASPSLPTLTVPAGYHGFDTAPPNYKPPAPLPLPQVVGDKFGDGCWSGSKYSFNCWKVNNAPRKTCCSLKRSKGITCGSREPFDKLEEFCCMVVNEQPKCFMIVPSYVGS